MATAYERYKKDTASKEVDTIKDYTDFQKAVLQYLEKQTEPKKPVKWFFGKDKGDVGGLTLATTLSPQLKLQSWFTEFKDKEGKVIKPKYVNLQKWIRNYSGQREKRLYIRTR